MARLKKDAWDASSLRTKEVEVEELGGSVLIRELPAIVSADFAGLMDVVQVGREQRAKIDVATMERRQFAYGVISDDGEPLYTEHEVKGFQSKHGNAFRTVVKAIDEFSGIDKEAIEEAEARFPGSGTSPNGANLDDAASAGDGGPDLHARVGARAGEDGSGDDDG